MVQYSVDTPSIAYEAFAGSSATLPRLWSSQNIAFQPLSIAYGNKIWVILGVGGGIRSTNDGKTWSNIGQLPQNDVVDVCYAEQFGLFVGITSSGNGNQVVTSPDGNIWTHRSTPGIQNTPWRKITYGYGYDSNGPLTSVVAVAGVGNSGQQSMSSVDGINWILNNSGANRDYTTVGYVNAPGITFVGRYVGLSSSVVDGVIRAVFPHGGSGWQSTFQTMPSKPTPLLCADNLKSGRIMIAVCGDGSVLKGSSQYDVWTEVAKPTTKKFGAVCHGGQAFIAVTSDDSAENSQYFISPDGVLWTYSDIPDNKYSGIAVNPLTQKHIAISTESSLIVKSQ